MTDEREPLDDAPDPTEDTPDAEAEDTPEDEDSSQTDWTPKDRTEATRKITELAQERADLRRQLEEARKAPAPDEGEDDEDDGADYLGDQNALLAGEVYGPDVVAAATSVWDLLMGAQTTADYTAALEAYHEARSKGQPSGSAATAQADGRPRQEVVQPRVDTNRSDGPASDDLIAEAVKTGSLGDFVKGAVAKVYGPGPK